MLQYVVLTHLHSDHTTDFNDLVTTRWAMSPMENPLPVIGPPGTARVRRPRARHARRRHRVPARPPRGPQLGSGRPRARVPRRPRVRPGRRAPDRRTERPPAGCADHRVPDRARRPRGRDRRRHRPVRGPRHAVRRCRRLRADRDPHRPRAGDPVGAAAGHPRLPLHGRAGRADRGARRRRHARAHPPGAGAGRRGPRTSGSRWPPPTSTAPCSSAPTSPPSRPDRASTIVGGVRE